MPASYHIPDYVMLYLNKGGKYITDRCTVDVSDIIRSIDVLERRLHIKRFFLDRGEPLQRKRTHCFAPSSWKPPADNCVRLFCKSLREEILDKYRVRKRKANYTWLDRQAEHWIKLHRTDFVIVDADKGLGDCITPRPWVENELRRLLRQGFEHVTPDLFQQAMLDAKQYLHDITENWTNFGVLKDRETAFLRSRMHTCTVGSFRLRIKLHKEPNVGRPIANMSHSWLTPACLFLCEALLPVQTALTYVVSSSQEFLNKMPTTVPPTFEIATIDIRNLYPSIDLEHMFAVLADAVLSHYRHRSSYAYFVNHLIYIVLHHQYVEHRGEFFKACGIATGVQPGVFFANIYLNKLDLFILATHGSDLAFYARLVDDSVVCSSSVDSILDTMSTFHHTIVWDITSRGGRAHLNEHAVPFLDVSLSHDMGKIDYETYRKPLNVYLYIPWNSCHPRTCFDALVKGETIRLWRTCLSKHAFASQANFFVEKLVSRGYPRKECKKIVQRMANHLESSRLQRRRNVHSHRHFLVLTYSSTLRLRTLKCVISKHLPILRHAFRSQDVKLGLAFKVQRNLFARHFVANWL
jgi:hypothetical protein